MPTTNPVPSNNPTDLLFNAQKLDEVVSGSIQYYTDRFGVNRRTMAGIEAAADAVLGGIGYVPPVAYASGIPMTLATQTVSYNGDVYAPKQANLPFTTSGTFETAKFRVIQGLVATDLSASSGASMVGYIPAGAGAILTTVQAKLRITASDAEAVGKQSTQPAYAAVAVNFTRTTIDRHAFEDWSNLLTTDTGQGYCSFDAKPTMTTTQNQDHLVGYQSRSIYNGANNLTGYMHGYDTDMTHSGAGNIARVAGMFLRETKGTGPIGENYGLLIDPMTRGASNAGIFSGPGNYHYLGGTTGEVETGVVKAKALNFGVDTPGKEITYGYGSVGQANFGKHTFYDGKAGILATLDNGNGLAVASAIQSTYTITPGRFTYAQLPNAANGATAYCTNGRKVGEGAGAGTGVPVYYSSGAWRTYSNDAVVTV